MSLGIGAVRTSRAFARRVDDLFSAGGEGFRHLAVSHATSTAGDTLVTIALAGTLFFSVPSSEARGNVALYLLLTVAPFAVIGPALGRLLTSRPGAYRLTLIVSGLARAGLAIALIGGEDSLWLFPLAFALLVLSRSHGISRNAMLPLALDRPLALVTANAKLAQVGVWAGVAAAPIGVAALRLGGNWLVLAIAALAFAVAGLRGRELPTPDLFGPEDLPPDERARYRRAPLPPRVRLAQLATAVVRLVNGFLLLLLAFAFRDVDAAVTDFAALLAAAGVGFWLASLAAPVIERRLREEPTVIAALALEAGAAFVAAQWFGLVAASALALAAGLAWGTAKFAFDGLLQSSVRPVDRGQMFTRSETLFQLAWVIGAVIPTAAMLPSAPGLVVAGLAALAAQVTYIASVFNQLQAPS